MKVNFRNHMKKESLLSHLVLEGLSEVLEKHSSIILTNEYKDKGTLEIRLTVNDIEINCEKFCEKWQRQVNEKENYLIAEHLKNKIDLSTVEEVLYEFKEKIDEKIEGLFRKIT